MLRPDLEPFGFEVTCSKSGTNQKGRGYHLVCLEEARDAFAIEVNGTAS